MQLLMTIRFHSFQIDVFTKNSFTKISKNLIRYMKKTILLKYLKYSWIQIRKIILSNYQNNYVER